MRTTTNLFSETTRQKQCKKPAFTHSICLSEPSEVDERKEDHSIFIHTLKTDDSPPPPPSSLSTSGAGPQLLAACTAVGAFLGYQVRTNTLLSLSFLFCAFINKYLCCDTHVFLFIFLFSPLPLHLPRVHQIHTYEEWAAANTADLVKLQAKKTAEKM